jgi:hypothetical protein
MPSSPGQVSEASGQAYPPTVHYWDPDDEPGLLDYDCSDNASREASVEVLEGPVDENIQSEEEDIQAEDVDSSDSETESIHQGAQP